MMRLLIKYLFYFISPSRGPCCNNVTCQIRPASDNYVCRSATDCTSVSRCGGSVTCPAAANMPDRTRCNNNQKLCSSGVGIMNYVFSSNLLAYICCTKRPLFFVTIIFWTL